MDYSRGADKAVCRRNMPLAFNKRNTGYMEMCRSILKVMTLKSTAKDTMVFPNAVNLWCEQTP